MNPPCNRKGRDGNPPPKGARASILPDEPLSGRWHVENVERRPHKDWVRFIRGMLKQRYPEAERVVLGMDSLNTHGIESLCATLPAGTGAGAARAS